MGRVITDAEAREKLYLVKDDEGNSYGGLTYYGLKAFKNGQLEWYQPINNVERMTKNRIMAAKDSGQTMRGRTLEKFDSIPQYKAQKDATEEVRAKQEAEEALAKQEKEKAYEAAVQEAKENKPSSLEKIAKNVKGAVAAVGNAAARTADNVIIEPLKKLTDLAKYYATGGDPEKMKEIRSVTDYASKGVDSYIKATDSITNAQQEVNQRADLASENKFNKWLTKKTGMGLNSVGGEIVNAAGQMIPNVLAAASTGGASTLGNSAGIFETILRNPSFWSSAATILGPTIDEAEENAKKEKESKGEQYTLKDEALARTAGTIAGLINSGVEIGGVEDLVSQKGKKTLTKSVLDWAKSAVEEGQEEVVQSIVQNGLANYAAGRMSKEDFFSTTDDSAVINPLRSATEFGIGAIAGGVLGAPKTAMNAVTDTVLKNHAKNVQSNVKESDTTKQKQADSSQAASVNSGAATKNPIQINIPNARVSLTTQDITNTHINPDNISVERNNSTVNNESQSETDIVRNLGASEYDIEETAAVLKNLTDSVNKSVSGNISSKKASDFIKNLTEQTVPDGKSATDAAKMRVYKANAKALSSPTPSFSAETFSDYAEAFALNREAANNNSYKWLSDIIDVPNALIENLRTGANPFEADPNAVQEEQAFNEYSNQFKSYIINAAQRISNSAKLLYGEQADTSYLDDQISLMSRGDFSDASDYAIFKASGNVPDIDINSLLKEDRAAVRQAADAYYSSESYTINEAEVPKNAFLPYLAQVYSNARAVRDNPDAGEAEYESLWQSALDAADIVYSHTYVNAYDNDFAQKAKQAKSIIRNARIYIPQSLRSGEMGEGYNNLRKKLFGKINLVSENYNGDKVNIADFLTDMSNDFPEFFSKEHVDGPEGIQELANFLENDITQNKVKMFDGTTKNEVLPQIASAITTDALNSVGFGTNPDTAENAPDTDGAVNTNNLEIPDNGITSENTPTTKNDYTENSHKEHTVQSANNYEDTADNVVKTNEQTAQRETPTLRNEEPNISASAEVNPRENTNASSHENTVANEKIHDEAAANSREDSNAPLEEEATANTERSHTPQQEIADEVKKLLDNKEKFSGSKLREISDNAYGGTLGSNSYEVKDAYDAMELGVNQYILEQDKFTIQDALELESLLPVQSNRSGRTDEFQQFSTPPAIAMTAAFAANISDGDTVLEPSAGIGGIAVFAKREGAKVYCNELDKRRLEILKHLPFDGFYNENAEQLDNILGDEIAPDRVVMNPPFSSSASRNIKNNKIASKHIEEGLKILKNGGRLIAITGRGMTDDAKSFQTWWKDIKSRYNVRANLGVSGKNYNKYGTNFGIRIIIIDKTGTTTQPVITKEYDKIESLYSDLNEGELKEIREDITNERPKSTNAGIQEAQNGGNTGRKQSPGRTAREKAPETRTDTAEGDETVSDTSLGRGNKDVRSERDNGRSNERTKGTGDESVRGGSNNAENVSFESPDTEFTGSGRNGKEQEGAGEIPQIGSGEREDSSERNSGDENNRGVDGNTDKQPVSDDSRSKPENGLKEITKNDIGKKKAVKELSDSLYEEYTVPPLKVEGAKKHPSPICESAAMSAVKAPDITYKPNLPEKVIKDGILSDVQLEAVSRAGQSFEEIMPNGQRRGFFIGDGTGVGKGRTVAGIIEDARRNGRKKSLWISFNKSLLSDAKRDIGAVHGTDANVELFKGGRAADKALEIQDGTLFATYSSLAKGYTEENSNFKKIVDWFGKDYDGVIVFDEAHKMGNAVSKKGARGRTKPSAMALAGLELQKELPNARIVYASATGATDVSNLRYAERLGLWGEGTAFRNGDDFVAQVSAGGIAAMELVAQNMKAQGMYLSRNISYDGVEYDRLIHKLTKQQKETYDTLAEAWQIIFQHTNDALKATEYLKGSNALSVFWSSQQRFFNTVLTSMQTPSVIKDIEKELKKGHSAVIQLTSTKEAAQKKELERIKDEGLSLEDMDLTPRELIMSYLENAFPVVQHQAVKDEKGNISYVPIYDSYGKPVLNRNAVRMREELLDKIASIKMPDSPIDMIINHFGTDIVAENTGRSMRIVEKEGKRVQEKRSAASKEADVDAFQNGRKRIMIFSQAGGTGKSYHADRNAENQQRRIHYLLEAGWKADSAVQGFGRTHRSNESSAPVFKLVTTDAKGQSRFISTIAKRLSQLGALTKGLSKAGSQGIFNSEDNLENGIAGDTLAIFYTKLANGTISGIDGIDIIEKLGIKNSLLDEYGAIKNTSDDLRNVSRFLNRLLILKFDEQNAVFDAFSDLLREQTRKAEADGTLERGLENYKADSITIGSVKDVYTDKNSGAKTQYYELNVKNKLIKHEFDEVNTDDKNFLGFFKTESEKVSAMFQTSSVTSADGSIQLRARVLTPGGVRYRSLSGESLLKKKLIKINEKEARVLWDKNKNEIPEFTVSKKHLISGSVLPIWDKLPSGNVRVYRVLTDDGNILIGRDIRPSQIETVLKRLGVDTPRTKESKAQDVKDIIEQLRAGTSVRLTNGITLRPASVMGSDTYELTFKETPDIRLIDSLKKHGLFSMRVRYMMRYFIPTDNGTEKIIGELLNKESFVTSFETPSGDHFYKVPSNESYFRTNFAQKTKETAAGEKNDVKIGDIVKYAGDMFGIPINVGNYRAANAAGVFKGKAETIRTRVANDINAISHELGHYLDKKYKISSSAHINEAIELCDADFLGQYQKNEQKGEAVAEFIRMYLNGESTENAPEFSNDFFESIGETNSKKLEKLKDMIRSYKSKNVFERINATIVGKKEVKKRNRASLSDKAAWALKHIEDDLYPVKRVMDYVQKSEGKKIGGNADAYKLMLNSRRADSIASFITKEAFVDLEGNKIGGSLAEALKKVNMSDKKERADFNSYLKARHAPEWAKQGKRVFADEELESLIKDEEEAAKIIRQYEERYPGFKESAEKLYEYQKNLLKLLVESGGLSKQQAKKFKDMYPNYVPFYRAMDNEGRTGKKAKTTFANQTSMIKHAKGSGRETLDPIESIVANTHSFVKFALRNRAAAALVQFTEKVDGFGKFIEKVDPDKIPHVFDVSSKLDELKNDMSELSDVDFDKLGEAINNIFGDGGLMNFTPFARGDKQIFTVMKDGRFKYYQANDKELFNAIVESMPNDTTAQRVLNVLGKALNLSNVLITQFNYLFGSSNAIRDFFTAAMYTKNYSMPKFVTAYVGAWKDIATNSETYQKYKAVGGGHMSALTAEKHRAFARDLELIYLKDENLAKRIVSGWIMHPVLTIERMNEFIESAPRYAEFKGALKNGKDIQQALYEASDITTNFDKRGDFGGKVLNKTFRFSNASIQGLEKYYREWYQAIRWHGRDAAKFIARQLISAVLGAALLQAYNRAVDPEGWDKLSNYQKNNKYCIAIGNGKFFMLPKPREVAVPETAIERTLDAVVGKKEREDAFYQIGEYLSDNLLPTWAGTSFITDPLAEGLKDDFFTAAGNTLAGPFVDLLANRDYKGTPIVSGSYEDLPKKDQYTGSTSKLAYAIARAGDDSPLEVDHLLRQYTGILGSVNSALFPMDSDKRDLTLGFKNRFVSDSEYSTDTYNKIYERRDKQEEIFKSEPTAQNAIYMEKAGVASSIITTVKNIQKKNPQGEDEDKKTLSSLQELVTSEKYTTISPTDKAIAKSLGKDEIPESFAMSSMPKNDLSYSKNGKRYTYELNANDYMTYANEVYSQVQAARSELLDKDKYKKADVDAKIEMIKDVTSEAKSEVKNKYQKKYKDRFIKED